MRADLHIHSHYSDGLMSPEIIAQTAKNNGVELFCITDHDTILGVEQGEMAASELGLKFACGIEVSAYRGDTKVHMLGYGFDRENTDFKQFMYRLYSSSVKRAEDIISKLKKGGIDLTIEEIYSQLSTPHSPVHAMHIARAAVKKGYGANEFDFYLQHLALGGDAYSSVERVNPFETCEIIKAAGGFSSLAHPARIDLDGLETMRLIEELKKSGMAGIECVYSTHTEDDTKLYTQICNKLGFVCTGGSDTHTATGRRHIGQPIFECSDELFKMLKAR